VLSPKKPYTWKKYDDVIIRMQKEIAGDEYTVSVMKSLTNDFAKK